MTASFANARLCALPFERMANCVFAEDFINIPRVMENHATIDADPYEIDHGYTAYGDASIWWDYLYLNNGATVIVRFSTTETVDSGWLIGNILNQSEFSGIVISVDSNGILGYHSDGISKPTSCRIDMNYADGEIHTVAYVVNTDIGKHTLYVDDESDEQDTACDPEMGNDDVQLFTGFRGTIYKVRIFDSILAEDELVLYCADELTDFYKTPIAAYRCDEINDDTVGNKILDITTDRNDLSNHGASHQIDKYYFDFDDDYLDNLIELPESYTMSAIVSNPDDSNQIIQQYNDLTLWNQLNSSGGYWGYIYSLRIYNTILSQLQTYHNTYMQLYWQRRCRAQGAYRRLITEGVCALATFMDSEYSWLDCVNLINGNASGVVQDGSNGSIFVAAESNLTYDDNSNLHLVDGSICVYVNFESTADGTLVDKGTNYKFRYTTIIGEMNFLNLFLNNSSLELILSEQSDKIEQLAVTFRYGYKPRFFINGIYVGEGNEIVEPDNTDTTDLVIGTNNELSDQCEGYIKHVCICNQALTDREIKALYEESQIIGVTEMEAGNRTRNRTLSTAVAVAQVTTPGGAFQLVDVTMQWNTAPTTSQKITIKSTNADGDVITEADADPSVAGILNATTKDIVFRFDKRFPNGTTITVAYTNTDGRTIKTNTVYQLDQSVV
jgi:hypothetical protein